MDNAREDDTSARTSIRKAWLSSKGKRFPYGLGTAYLREPGNVAVLEHAYTEGFRYFDSSLHYGDSELVLGRFLRTVPRKSLFLATKTHVAGHRFAASSKADISSFISDCLHQSLQRLGVEEVDLYQLHDLATAEGLEVAQEVGRRLQEQGYFRYLGATGRNLEVLKAAVGSGWFDTVLTYSDYTPIRQSAGPVLRQGAEAGVAMINATPLSNGLLAGEDPRIRDWPSGRPPDASRAASLYDLCQAAGVSSRTVALQFPLHNPDISITLTGPASVDQVDSTLSSLHEEVRSRVWEAWSDWNDEERDLR